MLLFLVLLATLVAASSYVHIPRMRMNMRISSPHSNHPRRFPLFGKKKGGGGASTAPPDDGEAALTEQVTTDNQEKMKRAVDSVQTSLTSVRTGRASPNMLDRVMVMYYDTLTPLSQVSSISVPSAQQLQVDVFDKSALKDVEKGIIEANLGLVPNNDGNVIRLNIPSLTEDRRKEMVKQSKALGEEGKTGVRNARRDSVAEMKALEKGKKIGKDTALDGIDVIEEMTKKSNKEIDDLVAKKESEVLKV
ncbi:hypothetical protein ScalyP_jg2906 [Parmales sp. scaly parma]|nr:hypothetical protein ScalyP_jg2906 [Parmales sp. scaly parma]